MMGIDLNFRLNSKLTILCLLSAFTVIYERLERMKEQDIKLDETEGFGVWES